MINYDFTTGRYRAKIKTTYKRDDMSMNDYIYSDPYEFTSTHELPSKTLVVWDRRGGIKTDILRNAETTRNLYLYNDDFLYGYKTARQFNDFVSNPNVRMQFASGYIDPTITNVPIFKITADIYTYNINDVSALSPTQTIFNLGMKGNGSSITWFDGLSGFRYQDYVAGTTTTYVGYSSSISADSKNQLLISQVGWQALIEFAVTKITVECGDYEIVTG